MRRCIGCNESREKKDLYRITYYNGQLALDRTGRAAGRGVYLCKNLQCAEKARKRKAFQRSLRTDILPEQIERIFRELENEERRVSE